MMVSGLRVQINICVACLRLIFCEKNIILVYSPDSCLINLNLPSIRASIASLTVDVGAHADLIILFNYYFFVFITFLKCLFSYE